MSRSNPTGGNTSPIKTRLQFSGGEGIISYFDKSKGEKGEKVELQEFTFTVLDVRNSITGFEEATKSAYSSNLIADTGKEVLNVVKWKEGKSKDVISGLYKDIKDNLKAIGAKFAANIIGLAEIDGVRQIVSLQLHGAALNNWIEFTKEHSNNKFYDYKITITKGFLAKRDEGKAVPVTPEEEAELDAKLKKNPRASRPVWFYTAAFTFVELTEDEINEAMEEDKKVQAYFNSAPASTTSQTTEEDTTNVTGAAAPSSNPFASDDDDDDLPF